jgi:chromosome segregation ATPase
MNDTPTPETDALAYGSEIRKLQCVHANVSRRLERERDFERKFNLQIMESNTRITKERDKALRYVESAKSYEKVLKNENNKLRGERDSLTDQRDFAQNLIRILERERNEAREYADKLVAHKDMICLPRDLEVLREANLGLAMELHEARNEIIGWKNKWDCAVEMAARAENALDELAERLDFQEKLNRESIDQIAAKTKELDEMTLRWEQTNDALFAERALADRLAQALDTIHQKAQDTWVTQPSSRDWNDIWEWSEKALEAWKEERK